MIRSLMLLIILIGVPAKASYRVSQSLMMKIAQAEGIPFKLLQSIAYVESRFHPWSLNIKGQSYLFASQQQAEAFLDKSLKEGHKSIDIGCAQINWQWHGHHFQAAKDLLSPTTCLKYAARLLKSQHRLTKSWMKAALLYHSSNPQHQQIYRQRLIRYLTQGQKI